MGKLDTNNPVANRLAASKEALRQRAATQREINKTLASLVQSDGWRYAQLVGNEIQQEFACKPGDPKWEIYTTIQYALNQLFGRVRQLSQITKSPEARAVEATESITEKIEAEIKAKYGNRSRGNSSASAKRTASRRRKTGK